jgi:hypothetical protein
MGEVGPEPIRRLGVEPRPVSDFIATTSLRRTRRHGGS